MIYEVLCLNLRVTGIMCQCSFWEKESGFRKFTGISCHKLLSYKTSLLLGFSQICIKLTIRHKVAETGHFLSLTGKVFCFHFLHKKGHSTLKILSDVGCVLVLSVQSMRQHWLVYLLR